MTQSSVPPSRPSFDQSLTDPAPASVSARRLTYPLGDYKPDYGVVHPIADGVGWTRLPIPDFLDHINVWVLDDDDAGGDAGGVAIVDTGIYMDDTKAAWEKALGGRKVSRVFVTHFHPDHVGAAGWLCETHDAPLWMNRTEWLFARMLTADVRDAPPVAAIAQNVAAGWTPEQLAPMKADGWGKFASVVSPIPMGHIPLRDGDTVRIGKRDWKVWLGSGHTPEHVCLVDEAGGLMIAGDQVLPKITSNISLSLSEPTGDPLGDWLASIEKFRALPDDLLVLPAHGEPFHGLHARLDRLETGHREGLKRLHAHIAVEPRRAVDCFGMLFKRAIDDSLLGLATGEAMAHLRHLEVTGCAVKEVRDGVWYYSAA